VSPAHLGSFIAAAFGLVYVVVNAGALPSSVGTPVSVLGAIAFLAVLAAMRRAARGSADASAPPRRDLGGRYWLVVAGEVVALVGGLAVLNGPLDAPEAGVAWVSVIVGLHFFALAAVFAEPSFRGLGASISALGALGLLLVVAGASEGLVAAVSGVVPGAVLLGFAWWGVRRAPAQRLAPA
jgi:uncharacterized membrane protein